MNLDRKAFINEVAKRIHRLFSASKEGYKAADVERHRLEGFIECGVYLNLTTRQEMAKLMDDVHYSVFKKTIRERQDDKSSSWQYDVIDYSRYEQPAYERHKAQPSP